MKISVAAPMVVALGVMAVPAMAAGHSFGHSRDPHCSYEVPMGATVDAEGNVTKDGATIHHADFSPCEAAKTGGSAGGWYEQVGANSVNVDGYSQFNLFFGAFTVPPAPNESSSDTSSIYIFPGLENWTPGAKNPASIMQAMLIWGYNTDANTGEWWTMEGEFNWGPNIHGSGIHVYPGDSIYYEISQVQTGPDLWEIDMEDTTYGWYYYFYAQPASSWPKYNNAYLAALEGYGQPAQTSGLNSCSELPNTTSMSFPVGYLYEPGPSWNSSNYVSPNMAWGGNANGGIAPSCNFQAVANSQTSATLYWTP
jgi:hypothetical protein